MHATRVLNGLLTLALIPSIVSGAVLEGRATNITVPINAYVPQSVQCPKGSLTRPANGLSPQESSYVLLRQQKTNVALSTWLKKVNAGFNTTSLPVIALADGAGGYRAMLNAAGTMQALDSRDSNSSMAGLYQGITYHAGTSGGGWFVTSLAASNWTTVSNLQKKIYRPNLPGGFLVPPGGLIESIKAYKEVIVDISGKAAATFPTSIADAYGRLLSYNFFPGGTKTDGSVQLTMSGLATSSNFTSGGVPYPMLVSRGLNNNENDCMTPTDTTQYEITPYEFGSWDAGVRSFTNTQYLGSKLQNGTAKGLCVTNFDNLGFMTAATSNIYPGAVCGSGITGTSDFDTQIAALQAFLFAPVDQSLANLIPNPFLGLAGSPAVANTTTLGIQDGGFGQYMPIWPFIQPARNAQVIIAVDACGDNSTNYACTGLSLVNTYNAAQGAGLKKMPFIPTLGEFVSRNINISRAQFFGCGQPDTVTIVWLPLADFSYMINVNGYNTDASAKEVDGLIANGNLVATQGNDPGWPTCLACAMIMKNATTLPTQCEACFQKYCVNPVS